MQYDLAEFALKMVAPNNKLIYDDKGNPVRYGLRA